MKVKINILVAVGLLAVVVLSGCSNSSQRSAAHRRWDRAMEQARVDAINLSIEQGNLQYARVLLKEIAESESAFADTAAEALDEMRLVTEQFAQARSCKDVDQEDLLLY